MEKAVQQFQFHYGLLRVSAITLPSQVSLTSEYFEDDHFSYTMVFTWIDWNAVRVAQAGVRSETIKTASPSFIMPLDFIRSMVFDMLDSMSSDKSVRMGITPHCKVKAIRASLSSVKANMGGFGRLRERSDAISPCFV